MRSVTAGAAAAAARALFVTALVAGGAVASPATSHASEVCAAPDARGTIACTAGMDDARVRAIAVSQDKSQWCWAASISMIFASHGFRLPQDVIVKDINGNLEDANAPSGEFMTNALRRQWLSPEGRQVAVFTRTGDIAANRYEMSNAAIATELAEGRPLLIGTRGHAMVLVKAHYERRRNGDVVITGGTVIDPLPDKGVRKLARGEMVLSYVSAVQVSEVRDSPKVHAFNSRAGESGQEF